MALDFLEVDGPTTPGAATNDRPAAVTIGTDGSGHPVKVQLEQEYPLQAAKPTRRDCPPGVATQLTVTPLAGRRRATVKNNGTDTIDVGFTNALLPGLGIPLQPGESITEPWGPSVDLWVAPTSGTQDVLLYEGA